MSMVKRSDTAMARELDGEVVILDIPSGRYFTMNDVGALVWNQLEVPVTTDTLTDAVVEAFDVDWHTAAGDLAELLVQLIEAGLVEDA
jgi:Coenzyme PQQ synthesis protein D (PqqD)